MFGWGRTRGHAQEDDAVECCRENESFAERRLVENLLIDDDKVHSFRPKRSSALDNSLLARLGRRLCNF